MCSVLAFLFSLNLYFHLNHAQTTRMIISHPLLTFIINACIYNECTGGSISCGDTISGRTSKSGKMANYSFAINDSSSFGIYLQFDSCSSKISTILHLFDRNWQSLSSCSDCGQCNVSNRAQLNIHNRVKNGLYYFGIGSPNNEIGDFRVNIGCDASKSFSTRNGLCSLTRGGIYECKCNAEECRDSTIRCLDAANCRVQCHGDVSCADATIIWPSKSNKTQQNILCDGVRACSGVTFPQPLAFENYEFECNQIGECQGAIIKCPLFADCHIICSEEYSCYDTIIEWSPYIVQSTLSCTHFNGCNSVTSQPPKVYTYEFEQSFSYSTYRLIANSLQISENFDIYFRLRMNDFNNANYTILSLMNENINNDENELMSLSMNYEQNLIKIGFSDVNDAYLIHGILPTDAQYHSFHLFFNQNGRHIVKMDDVIYLNVIAANIHSPFSSLSTNNHTFSLYAGHKFQSSVAAKIKNIKINIDLMTYYQQTNDAIWRDSVCMTPFNDLFIETTEPIAAYWDETLFLLDGLYGDTLYGSFSLKSAQISFESVTLNNMRTGTLFSQSWTQIENILYVIDANKLFAVDLIRRRHTESLLGFDSSAPSLCDNGTHLFVQDSYTIKMYEIETFEWINTKHSLPILWASNCQIAQNKMYIFGGFGYGSVRNSIYEYNLLSDSLSLLNTSLFSAASCIRSMQKGKFIYLYAGDTVNHEPFALHIFDTSNHQIFVTPNDIHHAFSSGYIDEISQKQVLIDSYSMYYYEDDAVLLDFTQTINQIIVPGQPLFVLFEVFGCSQSAHSHFLFTLKSMDKNIGINHEITVRDGQCDKICDLYQICWPCANGIVPLIYNHSSFIISISSQSNIIKSTPSQNIELFVAQCPIGSGYAQNGFLIYCTECPPNSFKVKRGNEGCYECDKKMAKDLSCDGSNIIKMRHNVWIAATKTTKSKTKTNKTANFISLFDISSNADNDIFAVSCPPLFCCQSVSGCSFIDSFAYNENVSAFAYNHDHNDANVALICAEFRNYQSPLCSRCIDGYYEVFGSAACAQCKSSSHALWISQCVAMLLVCLFLYAAETFNDDKNAQQTKKNGGFEECNQLSIMIFKVTVCYYQALNQILSSHGIVHSLLPFVTFFHFSFDFNASAKADAGYCVFPYLGNPLIKMLFSPFFFILFAINLLVIGYLKKLYFAKGKGTNSNNKIEQNDDENEEAQKLNECEEENDDLPKEKEDEKEKEKEIKALNVRILVKMFVIMSGSLLFICFKLMSCTNFNDSMVHFYDASSQCFGAYFVFGCILFVSIFIFLLRIFVKIYYQSTENRKCAKFAFRFFIAGYKEKYWFYEIFSFFRRFLIAFLCAFRYLSPKDVDSVFLLILMIFLWTHSMLRPFEHQRLNFMEGSCLFCLILLIAASNRLNEENEQFANIFLCICVFVPLLFIIYPIPKIVFDGIRERILQCLEEQKLQQIKKKEEMALEMDRRKAQRQRQRAPMNEIERKQMELERLEALLIEMEKEEAAERRKEEQIPNAPEESDDHETSVEASQNDEIVKPEKMEKEKENENEEEAEKDKKAEEAEEEDKNENADANNEKAAKEKEKEEEEPKKEKEEEEEEQNEDNEEKKEDAAKAE